MNRKAGDHLSAKDKAFLVATIEGGDYSREDLLARFKISERSLNRHIAAAKGKAISRPLASQDSIGAVYRIKQICLVEGCLKRIVGDGKRGFCEDHQFRPPANAARMMARRA
jgi:hypothetical protein